MKRTTQFSILLLSASFFLFSLTQGPKSETQQKKEITNEKIANKKFLTAPPYPGIWKTTRIGFKSKKSLMRISPEAFLEIKRTIPSQEEVKCAVVLVEFQDRELKVEIDGEKYSPQEYFREMIFGGIEENKYYKFPTFKEYWSINSAGKLKITGEVFGPYKLPYNLSDYACGFKNSSSDYFCGLGQGVDNLVRDLVDMADPDINFSEFDEDGDGEVDCFIVIHSGKGAETQEYGFQDSSCCDIWSRAFKTFVATSEGVRISSGVIAAGISELFPYGNMGLLAHEFGHLLGLPDLYDTQPKGLQSCGVGPYSLMGYGLYKGNPPGTLPSHLSPWERIFLGWAYPESVSEVFCDSISPSARTDKFLKVPAYKDPKSPEYFLVEYRKKEGFEADFPSDGVLIWYIDEKVVKENVAINKVNINECFPGCGDECGEIKDKKGRFLTCKKHYGIKVVIPFKYNEEKGIFNDPWRFERTSIITDSVKCLVSEPNDFWKSGETFPEIYTSSFGYKGEPHSVVISIFGKDDGEVSVGATTKGDEIRFAGPKIDDIFRYNWVSPGGEYEGIIKVSGTPPIYMRVLSPQDAWFEIPTEEGERLKAKRVAVGEENSEVRIKWRAPDTEMLTLFKVDIENCIQKIEENWSVRVQNPETSLDTFPQDENGMGETLGCSCNATSGNTKITSPLLNIIFLLLSVFVFLKLRSSDNNKFS